MRNGRTVCILYGDECENAVHISWDYPAYKVKREGFMVKVRAILGEAFKDFEALDNIAQRELQCCIGHDQGRQQYSPIFSDVLRGEIYATPSASSPT